MSAQPSSTISSPANGRIGQKPCQARNAPTPHGMTQAPAKNTCAPRTLSEQFGQISMRSGSLSNVSMVTRNGPYSSRRKLIACCASRAAVAASVSDARLPGVIRHDGERGLTEESLERREILGHARHRRDRRRLAIQPAKLTPRASIARRVSCAWFRHPSFTPTTMSSRHAERPGQVRHGLPLADRGEPAPGALDDDPVGGLAEGVEIPRRIMAVSTSIPASFAAICGETGGSKQYGFTSVGQGSTLAACERARASALRKPSGCAPTPEATGFMTATRSAEGLEIRAPGRTPPPSCRLPCPCR